MSTIIIGCLTFFPPSLIHQFTLDLSKYYIVGIVKSCDLDSNGEFSHIVEEINIPQC